MATSIAQAVRKLLRGWKCRDDYGRPGRTESPPERSTIATEAIRTSDHESPHTGESRTCSA
ncbi:hypothetical protein, partial [Pseudomonas sp. GW460-13]|uniref:hypothetical protein n=1 Tax=Pseudomonas sp. GW460-13 TaxID=2070590 RepID=UPI001C465F91